MQTTAMSVSAGNIVIKKRDPWQVVQLFVSIKIGNPHK